VEFVLATANAHKAREITDILRESAPEVALLARPDDVPDVDETGDTLEDNARLKAVALCEATGRAAIADDTGLEVDALDGAPGVHSARYAGEDADRERNIAKLLVALRGVGTADRTARFTTVAIARYPDGREAAAVGTIEGTILTSDQAAARWADGGFGYDRVFVPDEGDGRTFAEMTDAEKHEISHRGRAFRTLADGLRIMAALEASPEATSGTQE
jgi:XTP/dITP diphosphohydrolase